jgi:hypothetical protein
VIRLNYEIVLRKLIGKYVAIYLDADFYADGIVAEVVDNMVKLNDLNGTIAYIEFLQDIKCIVSKEDVEIKEEDKD